MKKNSVLLDLVIIFLCSFMAYDYFQVIQSGDDMFHRKIILALWIMAFLGWSLKLIRDLRNRRS